jgi:addiction module HigA family antidote
MPKTAQTPTDALKSLMGEYQVTAFSLSKAICLSNSAVQQIIKGKNKITVSTASRLAKFFGNSVSYWLDLQLQSDLAEAAKDKELANILKSITKAKKPEAKPGVKAKAKPARKTTKKSTKKTTLADKRKAAAKTPGAKPASRKPAAK